MAGLGGFAKVFGLGIAGSAFYNAATKKPPKGPQAPAALVPPTDTAASDFEAAKLRTQRRMAQALRSAGPRDTILSGPRGIQQPAQVQRETLLGM